MNQQPVQPNQAQPVPPPPPAYAQPPPIAQQPYPVISAMNLCKWYGNVIGLNNLNVQIGEGITGIVGPNGAGKSTLFKLIIGSIKSNAGGLFVMGQPPWGNTKQLAHIGFCPDYDFLPLNMTGREYLKFLGGLHAMDKVHLKDRIAEVTDIVKMEKDMDREMAGYSKGMRQRLKIAGALIHSPKLLLLDEPLAGTDPLVRRDIINLVKKLHLEHGHNIIVSSHVLHEIERMTHNIVLIYKGRAVAQGDISEIRGLIDHHPHNIVIEGSNITELAKVLMDQDFTVSVGYKDDRNGIIAKVTKPDDFFDRMPELVESTGCEIDSMYSMDDDLGSIFKYLVGW
ncbi:MAG: ABC transporter ATP-binding protein [Thermoplasmata archaeon]|nr:ABC transporter ATP-binding protein [Thermoplasmata archaeon]